VVAAPTLLFRVGATTYGCDISDAQEIIPLRPVTRLPGAPACVRGLMNMRGIIVTVLDLGVRFDPARPPATDGSILLIRYRDRLVGAVVDEVLDVRVLEAAVLDADTDDAVGKGTAAGGDIVRCVVTVGDDAVILLDLDVLITQVLLS
jgi:purine-binding chemotaxis protein CheW